MRIAWVVVACIVATVVLADTSSVLPVTFVPSIDIDRCCTTWYEVARLPNWFEKKYVRNITATFSKKADGTLTIIHRSRKEDSTFTEAIGTAHRPMPTDPYTKLKVCFAPKLLSLLPFIWKTYWIIDIANDYSYGVIGDPKRKYLWVLSRTPQLPDSTFQGIVERAKKMGYETDKLIMIPN